MGKDENILHAQTQLLKRAKANGLVAIGKYEGEDNLSFLKTRIMIFNNVVFFSLSCRFSFYNPPLIKFQSLFSMVFLLSKV